MSARMWLPWHNLIYKTGSWPTAEPCISQEQIKGVSLGSKPGWEKPAKHAAQSYCQHMMLPTAFRTALQPLLRSKSQGFPILLQQQGSICPPTPRSGVTQQSSCGHTYQVCTSGLGCRLTDLRNCKGCGSSRGWKKTSTEDLRPSRNTSCPRSRAVVRLTP